MDIRTRLTILVLSLILPAFAAAGIAVWFVYAEQNRAQEQGLTEASRALSQLIDSELMNAEKFLQALAASPDLADGKLEHFYRHAKTLSKNDESTIILSSLEGQQILNTRLPFGSPPRTINPRLLELRRFADPYRTIVSDLFFSPLAQRYDFAVQVPVVIKGSLRYYLSLGREAQQLQQFLSKQRLPQAWIASVVDREGLVVARSAHSEQFIGKHATGSLAEKIRKKQISGINDGFSLDGKPVKAFFHRAPNSEWTLVLSVPTAELTQPAIRASVLLTVLLLFILSAALFLTRRYVIRTLVPIQQLRENARRLGSGQAVQPYVSGIAELDEVSTTLAQAGEQSRAAKADLERRVAEAIDSTERAQRALLHSQKLEALGRLTGGVAHDFNNVLQTLTASLQLIRVEADPHQIPSRLAMCEKAIERATALVAQLRAFGRAQDAYQKTVQADDAIRSVMPMLKSALPSAIALDARVPSNLWPVTVDLTQFDLALLNLVMNARDAISGAGSIAILAANHVQQESDETLPAGEYVRIQVSDTGSGMPPEVVSKAFDPFFTTKSVEKGNGLGLPQAYGFATQSHGTLTLDSAVGAGTTATLYLPRSEAAHAHHAAPSSEDSSGLARLHGTILFVEDDRLIHDSVAPMLEKAGAQVIRAANSEEALAVLASGVCIDVLFSDIIMPGNMNGLMLAKHVRMHFPRIAIVLATGYFNENIDLPEAQVLTKPYKATDAMAALAEAMASHSVTESLA